jgi:hypothetical protein
MNGLTPVADVRRCHLVRLPSHGDASGSLVPIEPGAGVPFTVRRVFTVTGTIAGQDRGGHANANTTELLVCLAGRVTVRLSDGVRDAQWTLDDPRVALLIEPMLWVDLEIKSDATVLMALCDTTWRDAKDAYFRDRASWYRALRKYVAA